MIDHAEEVVAFCQSCMVDFVNNTSDMSVSWRFGSIIGSDSVSTSCH